MVICFIFYHPQVHLQSPQGYIREKPPWAHMHVRNRAHMSQCTAIQHWVFPHSTAGCVCAARLETEPCWPLLSEGSLDMPTLSRRARGFCCTARSHATPFAPRLPPGLFANTEVAAVCHTGRQALADLLPGLVLCALSHVIVIFLPCITQAVV